jgi:membrane associated rhomboid family serine protease
MKTIIRRLARGRHAVYAAIAEGVIATLFGVYLQTQPARELQDNPLMTPGTFIGLGITGIVLAGAALIATYVVSPVLEGEIVGQQPQLPDVQTHMRRTHDLSQVV